MKIAMFVKGFCDMKATLRLLVMLSAVMLTMLAPAPASAAVRGCTFKKTLKYKGSFFDVVSRRTHVCSIQVVEIVVRRRGRTFAAFKTDVDFLAHKAWTADLNDDGKPELIVASKDDGKNGRGTLDVYWLEGNIIKRAAIFKNEEGAGYLGRDSFRLDGRKIVRSFPVYRDGDSDNSPSGGTRILHYTFQDGRLELNGNKDEFATTAAVVTPEPLVLPAEPVPVPAEAYPTAAPDKPIILAKREPAPQ